MHKLSMKSSSSPEKQRQQQSSSPTVDKTIETANKQDNDDTNNEDEDDVYDYDDHDNNNNNNNNGNGRSSSSSVPSVRLLETSLPQNKFFGSNKTSAGGGRNMMMASPNNSKNLLKSLPPLFLYMETGDFRRAAERAKNHPREVKTWASIKVKSSATVGQSSMSTTKRLAIHQACFKVCTVNVNVGAVVVVVVVVVASVLSFIVNVSQFVLYTKHYYCCSFDRLVQIMDPVQPKIPLFKFVNSFYY
jgi:hypothetical protein